MRITQKYYVRSKTGIQGDIAISIQLEHLYTNAYEVSQPSATTHKLLVHPTKQNGAAAQYGLGYMCYKVLGVARNYQEARKRYALAANQGHAWAQYSLGYLYYQGLGVTKNYLEARKWFEQAAEQGHDGAQYNLGYMYLNAHGVTRNYTEARRWFKQAEQRGNTSASGMWFLNSKKGTTTHSLP